MGQRGEYQRKRMRALAHLISRRRSFETAITFWPRVVSQAHGMENGIIGFVLFLIAVLYHTEMTGVSCLENVLFLLADLCFNVTGVSWLENWIGICV